MKTNLQVPEIPVTEDEYIEITEKSPTHFVEKKETVSTMLCIYRYPATILNQRLLALVPKTKPSTSNDFHLIS